MDSLLSPQWYKVAKLKPARRRHVEVHRQQFATRIRYLLQDRVSGKFHQFSEEAWELIGRFDGRRTVEQAWREASEVLGDRLPSQGETFQLIAQLLQADLIACDDKRLAESLDDRRWRTRSRQRLLKLVSPLSIRIPLLDPDRFLERTLPWVAPLLGRAGLVAWCLLLALGLTLAIIKLPLLGASLGDRLFSLENMLLMALLYPVIKLIHEFGHAYAIKRWGGEVHDLGIMLLVFLPIPYVDASAARAFPDRRRRILVAAIGVMVELALASIAMVMWVLADPGLLRSLSFQVILIAGLSSLLFNGNPLMRYDAYYVLAELMNEPALGRKSGRCFMEQARQVLLGNSPETEFADYSALERRLLLTYAVASFLFRTSISLVIAVALVSSLPFVGTLLALLVVGTSLIWPVVVFMRELLRAGGLRTPSLAARRIATAMVLFLVFLFVIPLPLSTTVQGIVVPPEEAQLRAASDGFVVRESVRPGEWVMAGQLLLELEDDEAMARLGLARARLAEAVERVAAAIRSPLEGDVLRQEIPFLEQQVAEAASRIEGQTVRAPVSGIWQPSRLVSYEGQFFRRGESLGHVADPATLRVLAVIDEHLIQLVRDASRQVSILGADGRAGVHSTTVLRLMPTATHQLPHMALTTEGGGSIVRNPEVSERPESIKRYFWVELDAAGIPGACLDCRAFVRFEHPPEPVAFRVGRWMRRQFMSLLDD
jgi:putative peptide zinc metalloprotease protein